MNIEFIGKNDILSQLSQITAGRISFNKTTPYDAVIYELSSEADLKNIKKINNIPAFIVINTKDKAILEKVKGFQISGLFIAPLNGEQIINKLNIVLGSATRTRFDKDIELVKAKIIVKAEAVAPLPLVAQKLVNVTQSDKSTIRDIIDLIKQDQVLASKIIRLVNSSFYGIKQEITSIDRAIVLIGIQTVKNLALVVTTASYYEKPFELFNTTGDQLWEHAFRTASMMEYLAAQLELDQDMFFLAGLMHDIGKVVLVDFLEKPVKDTDEEQKQLSITHPQVAEMVLTKWEISKPIIDMVKNHHNKELSGLLKTVQPTPAILLYHANLVSHAGELVEDNISRMLDIIDKPSKREEHAKMLLSIATSKLEL